MSVLILAFVLTAEPCPPVALLDGDEALIARVSVALDERGVRRRAAAGCSALRVHVERSNDAAVALKIEADDRPAIARLAKDPDEAATIIESWARTDLTEPLLARELPPEAKTVVTVEPAQTPIAAPRPFAFGAAAIAGIGSDGSTWSGADVRGCFLIWDLCLGGRLAYTFDIGGGGDARRLDGTRSALDLGLIADLPIVAGDFEILPGVGVGQSIIRSERIIGSTVVFEDAGGLRLRGQIGVSWRFSDRLSARLDTALDYAPFARAQLLESLTIDGPDTVALAGEPRFVGWIRAGLDLGGI